MKKYIEFFGVLFLIFVLIAVLEVLLYYGNLTIFSTPGVDSAVISSLIVVGLFYRNIKGMYFYKNINVGNTLVLALFAAVILYLLSMNVQFLFREYAPTKSRIYPIHYVVLSLFFFPVIEELWFRVIIINRFSGRIANWLLVAGTALFFGLLHVKNINFVVSTFLFGVVLAYFSIRTRNILLVVLVHFFNNLMFIVVNSFFYETSAVFVFSDKYPHWVIAVVLITFFLVFYVFRKQLDQCLQKTIKMDLNDF